MGENNWDHEAELVESVLSDDTQGDDPGQGQPPASAQPQDSGDTIDDALLQAIERAVSGRIGEIRQDLEDTVERRVQSYSDKTAARLTKQQKQLLEQRLKGLDAAKDLLGPDYEQLRRQVQLEALLEEPAQDNVQKTPATQQPQQQPQQSASLDMSFAEAFIQTQLGDPQQLTAQQTNYLRQAQSPNDWIKRVNELATQRQTSPTTQGKAPATVQPVGGSSSGGTSPEALQKAYNDAAARGDMDELSRLGKLIDQMVARMG